MKMKFLEIHRENDSYEQSAANKYSLEEVLERSLQDLNDKVFKIETKNNDKIGYSYVHLKVKQF